MVEKLNEIDEKIGKLEIAVSDLKNFKLISLAVAAVFGLSGAYGASVLSQINSGLTTAQKGLLDVQGNIPIVSERLEKRTNELIVDLQTAAAKELATIEKKGNQLGRTRVLESGNELSSTVQRSTDGDSVTKAETYEWKVTLTEPGLIFFDATTFGGRDAANGALAGTYLSLSIDGQECALDSSYYPPQGGGISVRSSASCVARKLDVGEHRLRLYFTWRTDNASVKNPPIVNWMILATG